jgi:hypothetical protein
MSRRDLVGLVAAAVVLTASAPAGAATPSGISVTVDRSEISTKLGHKFAFHATITNDDSSPADGLIAHLNVLSYDRSVYVDPEDWSAHRTIYLPTIRADGSRTITWKMQAVNDGSFAVYVAAIPRLGAPGAPATGPAIRLEVAKRTTLNSQGILPLALGIPAFLGLLSLSLRLGRKRR